MPEQGLLTRMSEDLVLATEPKAALCPRCESGLRARREKIANRRARSFYDPGVPDQKPPRLLGGERETLLALLRYQRESLVRKVAGVDDVAARRSTVDSGTTLLWLVKHLAKAEALWMVHRFAGLDDPLPDDAVAPGDTLVAAVAAYRATWAQVDQVLAVADLDEPCRRTGDEAPVNLRWVLAHLLEETARHAGHADILRELIDGATGR